MCLMSYANNKGADQPEHPRSLISAFIVRCSDSIISLDSIAERTCCNLAGFVPTMDLDETSMEVSQTYASSYEYGSNLTMT